MERRFKQRLADAASSNFRAGHLGGVIASSGQVLQQGVALLIVYVGARAIIAGELSIGALIAATILAARTLAPMRQVVGAWQQLQTVRAAFARLDELLNEPAESLASPRPALQISGRHHLRGRGLPLQRGRHAGARWHRSGHRARARCSASPVRRAPARAPSPSCCAASITPSRAASCSTISICACGRPPCFASRSASSRRRSSCSPARSPRTSRWARSTASSSGSWPPPSSSAPTTSSSACPKATTPCSASGAAACPRASAS